MPRVCCLPNWLDWTGFDGQFVDAVLYKKKGGLLASKHILLGARSRTVTRERMVVISGQYIARIIHNSKHWSIATIYRFLARLAAKSVCVKMPGLNWQ